MVLVTVLCQAATHVAVVVMESIITNCSSSLSVSLSHTHTHTHTHRLMKLEPTHYLANKWLLLSSFSEYMYRHLSLTLSVCFLCFSSNQTANQLVSLDFNILDSLNTKLDRPACPYSWSIPSPCSTCGIIYMALGLFVLCLSRLAHLLMRASRFPSSFLQDRPMSASSPLCTELPSASEAKRDSHLHGQVRAGDKWREDWLQGPAAMFSLHLSSALCTVSVLCMLMSRSYMYVSIHNTAKRMCTESWQIIIVLHGSRMQKTPNLLCLHTHVIVANEAYP